MHAWTYIHAWINRTEIIGLISTDQIHNMGETLEKFLAGQEIKLLIGMGGVGKRIQGIKSAEAILTWAQQLREAAYRIQHLFHYQLKLQHEISIWHGNNKSLASNEGGLLSRKCYYHLPHQLKSSSEHVAEAHFTLAKLIFYETFVFEF